MFSFETYAVHHKTDNLVTLRCKACQKDMRTIKREVWEAAKKAGNLSTGDVDAILKFTVSHVHNYYLLHRSQVDEIVIASRIPLRPSAGWVLRGDSRRGSGMRLEITVLQCQATSAWSLRLPG